MGCLQSASPLPALLCHAAAHHDQASLVNATRVPCTTLLTPQLPGLCRGRKNPLVVVAAAARSSSSPSSSSSAVTYSANITTDLPLYEPPWASFGDYLVDRPRIFRAMFPDKRRSQRLNDEEWRIQMLPLQFLLVSVNPIVVMRLRCRSQGKSYPSGVPLDVTRILELQATSWELQGLDSIHMPPHFDLDVQGTMYSDRRGGTSRLKGHLEMSICLVLPQVFALVPDDILRSVAESALKRLLERMKQEVDGSLLADFRDFSREMRSKQEKSASLSPANASLASLNTNSD